MPERLNYAQIRILQLVNHQPVQPFLPQEERYMVDVRCIHGCDDGRSIHICEESHLVFYVLSYRSVRAANNDVWLDAYLTQLVDAVLGGLGFQLPSCGNVRNERHVEVKHILPPDIIPELPDGFKKGQAFDVTDGTTDLCDHNVHFGVPGNSCYPFLDLIGYVGDHLDCAAEVVSTTF